MSTFRVVFLPENVEVELQGNESLLRGAEKVGLAVKTPCGGTGSCGGCKVVVKEGTVNKEQTGKLSAKDLEEGWALACKTYPMSDLVVEVPKQSRLSKHQVLTDQKEGVLQEAQLGMNIDHSQPLLWAVEVELAPPTLTETVDDLNRLLTALRKVTGIKEFHVGLALLRKLATKLRSCSWHVNVLLGQGASGIEVLDVLPKKDNQPLYGLAVDIGTTTIAVYLVNLISGEITAKKGAYNQQAKYGDDVITRIVHAVEERNGLEDLQQAVVTSINQLIEEILSEQQLKVDELWVGVLAGNTTMTHLLLGIDPKHIRLEPYIPTVNQVPFIKAKELGLSLNKEAWLYLLPSIASYVGGDITSGVLASGMDDEEKLTLLIDIGTNGEMVLGNNQWLMACACSAGPAFEGGGIKYGMRAMNGAIERVIIGDDLEVKVLTIGHEPAIGICGSGLIDCIATLRDAGIIDRTGKINTSKETPRIIEGDEGPEFVLVWNQESGNGENICISENDIKNLIRSKGAIFAGIRVMLGMMELPMEAIDQVLIAGGFGNYINIKDAITIGLLPDLPVEKYRFIGNSSVKGAYMVLRSKQALQKVNEIGEKMTYLELSVGNSFMDEYVSALFLPHTDLSLFPNVKK